MTPVGILLEQFKLQANDGTPVRSSSQRRVGLFQPTVPKDRNGLLVSDHVLESISLKYLFHHGQAWGRELAAQMRIPLAMVHDLMRDLKASQLVGYKNSSSLHDYQYELTATGKDKAIRFDQSCSYYGSVPVCFDDYLDGVDAQSLDLQNPRKSDVIKALHELSIDPIMVDQLGLAIQSSRAMFLYGAPGNGKTSIAERLCGAFGETIYIPLTLLINDQIVRIYDPSVHHEVPGNDEQSLDQRWIRIKRPTIVVGGELTMEHLEMKPIGNSGVVEAPLHIKSNCGVFVVDDFGRQRISTTELLNRWIHPLETRHDFLNLPNGNKICFPFDQLVIFSTNLDPKGLVDEAFMRRIPYKIEARDPSGETFYRLLLGVAEQMEIEIDGNVIDYLIEEHFLKTGRSFRYCHARDLLKQVKNYCLYHEVPPRLTKEAVLMAVRNYFAG